MKHYLIASPEQIIPLQTLPASRVELIELIKALNIPEVNGAVFRFVSTQIVELSDDERWDVEVSTIGIQKYATGEWGLIERTELTGPVSSKDLMPTSRDIELWFHQILPPPISGAYRIDYFADDEILQSVRLGKSSGRPCAAVAVESPQQRGIEFTLSPFRRCHNMMYAEAVVPDIQLLWNAVGYESVTS